MLPANVLCVAKDTKQGVCPSCDKICYVSGSRMTCEQCHTRVGNMKSFSLEEYMSKQTISGREPFFKQNGYLVVNFDIKVKSNDNVWYTFDEWMSTELRRDAIEAGWNYVSGDVIRYELSQAIADDYEVGGIE